MRLHIVSGGLTPTNASLLAAFQDAGVDAALTTPSELGRIEPGDAALGRIDVLPTLEGVERGVWELQALERRGVTLFNRPAALLAAHDKLATALRLAAAGVPHPRTAQIDGGSPGPSIAPPAVVKPRFGSWGRDVYLCNDEVGMDSCLESLRSRAWFRQQGALVQKLVPPLGFDLRLVVAGGEVVGAIERVAADGEWRTNIALGGWRRPTDPSADACALAIRAATAIGGDLVGIDLLPTDEGWVVLEINGAVDFTSDYSLNGCDVFAASAEALVPAEPAQLVAVP